MNPRPPVDAETAAAGLRAGGVVAHPTEAVWGLACNPLDERAVLRLLALKQRSADKGLILAAGAVHQLAGLVDWDALPEEARTRVLAGWPGPHTWIVPASAGVPVWIHGNHTGVAVRVSAHPSVVALCAAFGGAIVSTSANRTGAPPPRAVAELDPAIIAGVDAILEGGTGDLALPTPIRDALTGAVLR